MHHDPQLKTNTEKIRQRINDIKRKHQDSRCIQEFDISGNDREKLRIL